MEFRLTYAGKLLSHKDSRSEHVHDMRRVFQKQLKTLWDEHPVLKRGYPTGSSIPDPKKKIGDLIEENGFKWKPIVTEDNGLMCALDILMLRNGRPGKVRADIDNRLKTLFDALRMAQSPQELAEGTAKPGDGETPSMSC